MMLEMACFFNLCLFVCKGARNRKWYFRRKFSPLVHKILIVTDLRQVKSRLTLAEGNRTVLWSLMVRIIFRGQDPVHHVINIHNYWYIMTHHDTSYTSWYIILSYHIFTLSVLKMALNTTRKCAWTILDPWDQRAVCSGCVWAFGSQAYAWWCPGIQLSIQSLLVGIAELWRTHCCHDLGYHQNSNGGFSATIGIECLFPSLCSRCMRRYDDMWHVRVYLSGPFWRLIWTDTLW